MYIFSEQYASIAVFANTAVTQPPDTEFVYDYSSKKENAGLSKIDPATFTKNTALKFTDYSGTSSREKATEEGLHNTQIKASLNELDKLLKRYGFSIKNLGFTKY